jgi:hypothetical protein
MKFSIRTHGIAVLGVIGVTTASATALAAEPDWKAVEQALGKAGQLQPGDVFRIGMPRSDLAVTVKGVPVKAGFALGSYAAFKQVGDQAMVMGDSSCSTRKSRRSCPACSRAGWRSRPSTIT